MPRIWKSGNKWKQLYSDFGNPTINGVNYNQIFKINERPCH